MVRGASMTLQSRQEHHRGSQFIVYAHKCETPKHLETNPLWKSMCEQVGFIQKEKTESRCEICPADRIKIRQSCQPQLCLCDIPSLSQLRKEQHKVSGTITAEDKVAQDWRAGAHLAVPACNLSTRRHLWKAN